MFDVALIQQCADPGIEIAIVEKFIAAAGSDNPLAITITSGNRVILPEAPKTKDDAMRLLQHFVGKAVVRVGVTQYPAGHGITDVGHLSADLIDPCENIRAGTTLFGKVYRIVVHAHGTSNDAVFGEAIVAWRTGIFEGKYVFDEPDPGPLLDKEHEVRPVGVEEDNTPDPEEADTSKEDRPPVEPLSGDNPNTAGIRVDLSGIGSQAPD